VGIYKREGCIPSMVGRCIYGVVYTPGCTIPSMPPWVHITGCNIPSMPPWVHITEVYPTQHASLGVHNRVYLAQHASLGVRNSVYLAQHASLGVWRVLNLCADSLPGMGRELTLCADSLPFSQITGSNEAQSLLDSSGKDGVMRRVLEPSFGRNRRNPDAKRALLRAKKRRIKWLFLPFLPVSDRFILPATLLILPKNG